MRTQGESCSTSYVNYYCLRWNWRPKEVCFTVFGRTFIPSLQESQIDYGCQTLVGSILEQN